MEKGIRLEVGGEVHELEGRPINIVCTAPDFQQRIRYPGRVELGTEATMHHSGLVRSFHEHTPRMVAQVFGIKDVASVTPGWCRQAGSGVMHCAGLIDLSLKLCQLGVPFVWVHPESYLHPSAQCGLADVMVEIATNPPKTLAEEERDLIDRVARDVMGDGDADPQQGPH